MKVLLLFCTFFYNGLIVMAAEETWEIKRFYQDLEVTNAFLENRVTKAEVLGEFYGFKDQWLGAGKYIIDGNQIKMNDFNLEYAQSQINIDGRNYSLNYSMGFNNNYRDTKYTEGDRGIILTNPELTIRTPYGTDANVTMVVEYKGSFETTHTAKGSFTETYFNLICTGSNYNPISPGGGSSGNQSCDWVKTRVYSGSFFASNMSLIDGIDDEDKLREIVQGEGLTPLDIAIMSAAAVALASLIYKKMPKKNVLDGHAMNEKGQVFYKPPWETGDAYWMENEEFLKTRAMEKKGHVWSEYGWSDKKDLEGLRKQRDVQKALDQRLYEQRLQEYERLKVQRQQEQELFEKYIQGSFEIDLEKIQVHPLIQEAAARQRAIRIDVKQMPIRMEMAKHQREVVRMLERVAWIDNYWQPIELPVLMVEAYCDAAIKKFAPSPFYVKYVIVKNVASEIDLTAWPTIDSIRQTISKGAGKAIYDLTVGEVIDQKLEAMGIDNMSVGRRLLIQQSVGVTNSVVKDLVFDQSTDKIIEKNFLELFNRGSDAWFKQLIKMGGK